MVEDAVEDIPSPLVVEDEAESISSPVVIEDVPESIPSTSHIIVEDVSESFPSPLIVEAYPPSTILSTFHDAGIASLSPPISTSALKSALTYPAGEYAISSESEDEIVVVIESEESEDEVVVIDEYVYSEVEEEDDSGNLNPSESFDDEVKVGKKREE